VVEEFYAKGHRNVLATHQMTWEITKDSELSRRGDCVVAVCATKGLAELSKEFRGLCKNDDATITAELSAGNITETIRGRGSHNLSLAHPTEIVGRRSTFASDRTIMVLAEKAACDLNRELVHMLTSPNTQLKVRLIVEIQIS
jgi:hypothetical protein